MQDCDLDSEDISRKVDVNTAHFLDKFNVTNQGGKPTFLGFEVNRAFAPFINFTYKTVIAPLASDLSDTVYTHSKTFAQNHIFKGNEAKSSKFASALEIVVAAAMLAIDPLSKIFSATKDYASARSKLYDEFKQVRKNTDANAYNNEVISVEYQRARSNMWDVYKNLAPEIPELVVQGLIVGFKKADVRKDRINQPISTDSVAPAEQPGMIAKALARVRRLLSDRPFEVSAGAAALSQSTHEYLKSQDKKDKYSRQPTAWRRIQALGQELQEMKDAENESGIAGLSTIDPRRIHNAIRSIFLQHEIDMGRGELTGANNLRALNENCFIIAEAVANGTLHTNALVNLVGERMVIEPKNGKRAVVSQQVVKEKIVQLQPKMGACIVPTAEEFYNHFDNAPETKLQLKQYLESMPDGIQKDCFASIFSYDVLKEAGWSQEKAVAAHTRAKKHMRSIVENTIKDLASKSGEELHQYNFTDNDLQALEKINSVLEDGNKKQREAMITSLSSGQAHSLLQNILGVAILQELQVDKDAWTKRVSQKPSIDKKVYNQPSSLEPERFRHHAPDAEVARAPF